MDPDTFTGALAFWESLDLLGFFSVAGSILTMAFYLGRRLGSVQAEFKAFSDKTSHGWDRNHEDHQAIIAELHEGRSGHLENVRRIGELEGKTKDC